MSFFTSLRKEWMEQVRTNRLLILTAVLLFFGLLSPLIAKYTPELLSLIPGAEAFAGLVPEPTIADAVDQYVKNVGQFGVLLALLLTMGMVVQEKEKGTAAIMLVKPVSRSSFLLAKFTAAGIAFLASTLLAGVGAYYYTTILFTPPSISLWMALNLLIWLQFLVYIALTLLFSTLVRSQAAAAGLGFAAVLLFSLLGSLPGLARYLPGQLISWGVNLLTNGRFPSAWPAVWVSAAMIAASLISACFIFKRQEL